MNNKHDIVKTAGTSFCAGLLSCLLMAGCSSDINLERYSLTEDLSAAAYVAPSCLQLRLTPKVNTGGLMVQTGAHTVVSAAQHRWAEPLDLQLTALFTSQLQQDPELLNSLLKDQLQLKVLVTSLQSNLNGQAQAQLLCTLQDANGKILQQQAFEARVPLASDGYSALSAALQQAFMEASAQCVAELKRCLAAE